MTLNNRQKLEQIAERLVDDDIFNQRSKLTQEEIDFLKANPSLLSKLTDNAFIKLRYIIVLFFIAITLAATAKILEYTEVLSEHPILNDLLTNVQFSVSMEMLGASIIAYFLEIVFEKRMKKNNRIREQLIKEINESQKVTDENL